MGAGIAILDESEDKLVHQMRMRSTMATALKKRQMIRIMNLLRK